MTGKKSGNLFIGSMIIPALILYVSIGGILLYTRALVGANLSSIIFHVLFFSATASSALITLSQKVDVRIKLAVVVSWVVALQLVVPLRLPDNIVSNYPDGWYNKQLVDAVLNLHSYRFGYGTGQAFFYSFYAAFQTTVATLALLTNADVATVLKFLPASLTIPFVILLFRFFRNFLSVGNAVVATQIAASCFWFINFASRPVQAAFGTLFALILLLSLTRSGTSWNFLFAMSVVGLTLSHFLSGIYVLIIIIAAKVYMSFDKALRNRTSIFPLSFSKIALIAVAVVAWLTFEAIFVAQDVALLLSSLYIENIRFVLSAGATEANPILTRLIGDAGVILYGILLGLGFIYLVFRKNVSPISNLLPFAFGSGVVFLIHLAIFGVGLSSIIDILPRGFLFVYIIGSPLAVFALIRVSRLALTPQETETGEIPHNATKTGAKMGNRGKFTVAYLMIVLMLLSSMYFYYPAFRYDNSAPLDSEDVRLPLENWRYAGAWSLSHISDEFLYGDKLAFNFVGSIGDKEVEELPLNGSLIGWMHSTDLQGFTIVLRTSSLNAPYADFEITGEQLQVVLGSNNLVYNSGESVVIIVVGQAP